MFLNLVPSQTDSDLTRINTIFDLRFDLSLKSTFIIASIYQSFFLLYMAVCVCFCHPEFINFIPPRYIVFFCIIIFACVFYVFFIGFKFSIFYIFNINRGNDAMCYYLKTVFSSHELKAQVSFSDRLSVHRL